MGSKKTFSGITMLGDHTNDEDVSLKDIGDFIRVDSSETWIAELCMVYKTYPGHKVLKLFVERWCKVYLLDLIHNLGPYSTNFRVGFCNMFYPRAQTLLCDDKRIKKQQGNGGTQG